MLEDRGVRGRGLWTKVWLGGPKSGLGDQTFGLGDQKSGLGDQALAWGTKVLLGYQEVARYHSNLFDVVQVLLDSGVS